jgi:hypothetical protein
MGLFGPPDVKQLKARGDVPGLIKALGHDRTHRCDSERLRRSVR